MSKVDRRKFLQLGALAAGATAASACAPTICRLIDNNVIIGSDVYPCYETFVVQEIRRAILERINEQRSKNEAGEVAIDWQATFTAQSHARYLVENQLATGTKSLTHWSNSDISSPYFRGLPYFRNHSIGGTAAIQESIAYDHDLQWIGETRQWIAEALRIHDKMFNQTEPGNADRLNILKPEHNKVSIGAVASPNHGLLVLTEEFINDYVALQGLTPNPATGAMNIRGYIKKELESTEIDSISVFWEPLIENISDEEKRKRPNHYPFSEQVLKPLLSPRKRYSDGTRGKVKLSKKQTII